MTFGKSSKRDENLISGLGITLEGPRRTRPGTTEEVGVDSDKKGGRSER